MSVPFIIKNFETGEILRQWDLLPKQVEFMESQKRFILFSGGFGAGKTMVLVLKAIYLSVQYPGNYGLLGREKYQELRDSLQADFLEMCPKIWIKEYIKSERKIVFFNGSVIIFRHLDAVSKDEIKSLNLGFVGIDQAEDIPYETFLGLRGRLRRKDPQGVDYPHQIIMTANPANTWLFREFKQNPDPDACLIEATTYENPHLSKKFIEDLEKYPMNWRKQFVEGRWDTAIMGDRNVFSREFIEAQEKNKIPEDRCDKLDDIRLYKKPIASHYYQMGIDPSEGSGADSSVISLVDLSEGEEVGFWRGKIQPDLLAYKAKQLADHWNLTVKNRVLIVPEVNGIGAALLSQLKKIYNMIYQREVFMKKQKEWKMVLGWKTTQSTKPLIVSHMQQLMREKRIILHTPELIEELKTFMYTDEATKMSYGADVGFNDDCVIAAMLGFFAAPYMQTHLLRDQKRSLSGLFTPTYNPGKSFWDDAIDKPRFNWLVDS